MKVLIVHNRYIHEGGEDVCVENEISVLRASGLDVLDYRPRNAPDLGTAWDAISAPMGNRHLERFASMLSETRPDIVHFHNLFPLFSPRFAVLAKEARAKTVMTLHNYRPLCLNGLFLTPSNEVCERCATGNYWPGIARGCYRGSRIQSVSMAAHAALARANHWYDSVDRFITPANFQKEKYVSRGWPEDRMAVQGHFLPDMPSEDPAVSEPYVLYLGRLSAEKGIDWLMDVFGKDRNSPVSLQIAGTGPLESHVKHASGVNISYLGFLQGDKKWNTLRHASALIMPSVCYENFPLAVVEANALGIPALVSDSGGLREIVIPGVNGERFLTRDSASFWKQLARVLAPDRMGALRRSTQEHARRQFSRTTFLERRLALYERLLRKGPNDEPAHLSRAAT